MPYRDHAPLGPSLIGYDPVLEIPSDHLARLVDAIVDETVTPAQRIPCRGNVPYDPRMCLKVLVYGYSLGVRSSRQLEEMCRDRLSFKLLTRGQVPSYHTLSSARTQLKPLMRQIWLGLFAVAEENGIKRCGRIVVDSTKIRANASPEAVVKQCEFDAIIEELETILKEAATADAAEAEGANIETRTGKPIGTEQIRDILRRVRKETNQSEQEGEAPNPQNANKGAVKRLTRRGLKRVEQAKATLVEAKANGMKHVCLTDPDARMMGEGRQKKLRECHSYDVATDNGLLVAAQSTQVSADNGKLEEVIEAARAQEPDGVKAVTADSGYYSGDAVAKVAETGIEVCVPDSKTAGWMRRGAKTAAVPEGNATSISFSYDPQANCYRCPQGNVLRRKQERQERGQWVTVYRTERECTGCPLASACLKRRNAKYRTMKVGHKKQLLDGLRQQFSDEQHRHRYHKRAPAVETVFAFLRQNLGFHRWLLREKDGVAAEASLFTIAYQMRKVHLKWAAAR